MFQVARLLLLLAVVAAVYCLVVVSILWPLVGLLLGAVAVSVLARNGKQLTTLGSARWAQESDLRRAGMLDATSGLILGRIAATRNILFAVRKLLWIGSAAACEGFWESLGWGRGCVVRMPRAIHTAVIAPTGAGKGVSIVVPALMTSDDSHVVLDPKGENFRLTAAHRRGFLGQRIVVLDPLNVATPNPDCFNPLDFIVADNPQAIDECFDLAKALVVRSPDEKEPHWSDSAEAWIAFLIAIVVCYGKRDESRSLQTVFEFLCDPKRLEVAIQVGQASEAWGGMLARLANQLTHFVDREKASTLSTALRHLRFLNTPAVKRSTERSSFDPAELRKGKMTIYLVLPPDHLHSKSALLRMWIGSFLRAVIRGGLQ